MRGKETTVWEGEDNKKKRALRALKEKKIKGLGELLNKEILI